MEALFVPEDRAYHLLPCESWPQAFHRFDSESVWAIRTALALGRPLLLRGQPGMGKSQLARAAALVLEVPFLSHVVDERSERDDLFYTYDAVSRLAEAQVSALTSRENPTGWREALAARRFVQPGVLWWALDWADAATRSGEFCREREPEAPRQVPPGWTPDAKRLCGPVVLIDEIDKADPSVPNGLLECLGNEGFRNPQLGVAVRRPDGAPKPLIFITTNEERELPAAFLRRCLVLQMRLPKADDEAIAFLLRRVRADEGLAGVSDALCREAAADLLADRKGVPAGMAVPGPSEFLDLIRTLSRVEGGEGAQREVYRQTKHFVLQKNLLD